MGDALHSSKQLDREIHRAKELRTRLENELLLNEVLRNRLHARSPTHSIAQFGHNVRRSDRVPVMCLAVGVLFGGAGALVVASGLSNADRIFGGSLAHAATVTVPPPAVVQPVEPVCTATAAPATPAPTTTPSLIHAVRANVHKAIKASPPPPKTEDVEAQVEDAPSTESTEPKPDKLAPASRTAQLLRDQLAAAIH